MRRAAVLVALCVALGTGTGCFGPMKLTRGLDDWANQQYVDSPWLGQLLLYAGILPAGYVITYSIDFLVLNVLDFWGESMLRGTGTPYVHRNPAVPEPR